MKTHITNSINKLGRWERLFGPALAIVLMVHTVAVSQSLEQVNLGSTGTFAILAGSLISNVPISAVTGDVGLSPAAGSGITGFGALEVTGTIYAVDITGPAGSMSAATLLTTAQGDLTIAYNNAAERTPVPTGTFLNPGSGDIGGLTLIAGLYKFTSTCSITSNVTLSGSSSDVWIFQIGADLNLSNNVQVILAGGAKASNIFWQVGTSAVLGTTSVFNGTIMADQSISLNTGAMLEGRALARIAAVTIASSTIVRPASTTAVETGSAPTEFSLSQNYPNPFNPSTKIEYSLKNAGMVSLKVYNLLGDEIVTLVNSHQEAGSYSVPFNTNEGRLSLASGVYFYRLVANAIPSGEAGSFVSVKKLVLMK